MKIKITKDQYPAFLKAVTMAESVSRGRTTLPVLSGALLTTKDGRLAMQTNNLDQSIVAHAEATISKDGQIGVSAADMARIAKLGESCDIELDKTTLIVRCGGTYKLPTFEAADFPALPEIKDGNSFAFTEAELLRMLSPSYVCATVDRQRHSLLGVNINLTEKQGVSTDGRRLALSEKVCAPKGWGGPTVPDVACSLISALVKGAGDLTLSLSESYLSVKADSFVFYTKLIEGNYPNFRQALPGKPKFTVKVRADALCKAIDRAVVAQSDTNAIKMTLSKAAISLSVTGKNGSSEVEADLGEIAPKEAQGFTIDLSSIYLRQAVYEDGADAVSLEFIDALSPLVVRGNAFSIIMPLRTL